MPVYSTLPYRRDTRRGWQRIADHTAFRVVLGVFVLSLGFWYVGQTNALSAKGFALRDLEKQLSDLQNENRRLDVELAEQQSLRNLETRLQEVHLVPVGEVEYAAGNTLAANR